MSHRSTWLALFLVFTSAATVEVREADACGVKLAIKTTRQRQRARPAPVATPERPIAQRPERTPVAAGPAQPPPRRPVDASAAPAEPVKPAAAVTPPPPPEKTTPDKVVVVDKQPEKTKPDKVAVVDKQPEPMPAEPVPPKAIPTSAKLNEEVFFAVGSATPNRTASIDQAIRWLKANPDANAVLEGYADPTGKPDANMTLSQQRAETVRDQMTAGGIDASRLEVVPFGDTKLLYGRKDGRNRHVKIVGKK